MFTKIAKNFVGRIYKRYPSVKFFREYSPKDHDRNEFLRKVMNYVFESKLIGDYLEFGVYKGNNFVEAVKMADRKRLGSMRFFAFDSFKGLPAPQGIDNKFNQFYGGQVRSSLNNFHKTLSSGKINLTRIEVISGWFKDTLDAETKIKLSLKSAAVVWVDCDLYESTVPVLKFVTDYIVDGTILVFDDWYHFRGNPAYGEQRAFRE